MLPHLFTIFILIFAHFPTTLLKNNPVVIQMDSKWNAVPFATEISEYFAEYSYNDYWKFLEYVQHYNFTNLNLCGKQEYDIGMEIANKLLKIKDDTLVFSLSMHERMPKIQFYQRIAEDQRIPFFCQNAFMINDKVTCEWKKVVESIGKSGRSASVRSWDRIYNITGVNQESSLVYYFQDILSPELSVYHNKLIDLAKEKRIRYVFQNIVKKPCSKYARLSGYGAVLSIKNTDYKVMDDQKLNIQNNLDPWLHESVLYLENYAKNDPKFQKSQHPLIKENLSKPEHEHIGLATVSYIMDDDQRQKFRNLLDVSQNFPSHHKKITAIKVNPREINHYYDFIQSISWTETLEDSYIFINGIGLSYDYSPFRLIPLINQEFHILQLLKNLNFNSKDALNICKKSVSFGKYSPRLNVLSDKIIWLNDLEKDTMYRFWSRSIETYLDQLWPGHHHEVGLNVFNFVTFIEPTSSNFFPLMVQMHRIIVNELPIRFGVVLLTDLNDPISVALSRVYYHLNSKSKINLAISFFNNIHSDSTPLSLDYLSTLYEGITGSTGSIITSPMHSIDTFLKDSNSFYHSLGVHAKSFAVFNGLIWDSEKISQNFVYNIINGYQDELRRVIKLLNEGKLDNVKNLTYYFMAGESYLKKIKDDIINPSASVLEPLNPSDPNISSCEYEKVVNLTQDQLYFTLLKSAFFINSEGSTQTLWLVLNTETETGISLLKQTLESEIGKTRIGVLFNSPSNTDKISASDIFVSILSGSNYRENAISHLKNFIDDYSKNKSLALLNFENPIKNSSILNIHKLFITKLFHIDDLNSYVIFNGRKFSQMTEENHFTKDDIYLLIKSHEYLYSSLTSAPLSSVVLSNKLYLERGLAEVDLFDNIKNILAQSGSKRHDHDPIPKRFHQYHVHLKSRRKSDPYLHILAIIDPLSPEGQKWVSLLSTLYEAINCEIEILLRPLISYGPSNMNRYYRYSLEPFVRFEGDDVSKLASTSTFNNLPQDIIFTFSAETLQSWFIESAYGNCDMDNIYLANTDYGCIGIYSLEYIILEGHAVDMQKHSPAAGLELTIGPVSNPTLFDTLVIFNLGYFQFKTFSGVFLIGLKKGKNESIEISKITSSSNIYKDNIIPVDSYEGKIIRVEIQAKKSIRASDGDEMKERGSWWSSVSSYFSPPLRTQNRESQTINIFTLATGLLYERFMRIMMLSLLNHTTTPVKFWFLKNYVSPQFSKSLSLLSNKYNFSYEFVQYQWPHWLRKQSEKQRVIWGYKILFLDVLFPLDIKKVIFVDADQIVRADMNELYTLDLGYAPYAFTPFCDDRPEMEPYRFWKKGYWREHLGRKPYHISALFVVDLERFREMSAGDIIRGQYQALSNDPNSLANLDQDLPNNIQNMVPIKSLPQEWLWCETWCSDKLKSRAKTIDMCNNPLTREAKLDRAIRIAPEFLIFDKIIKDILSDDIGAKSVDLSDSGDL